MTLAAVLALVAVAVAVVAVWRAALTLAAVALVAMAAVIPAAQAVPVSFHGALSIAEAEAATSATVPDTTSTTEPPTTTTTEAPPPPPESSTTSSTTVVTSRPVARLTTSTTGRSAHIVSLPRQSRVRQAEAIADGSGWNWRSAGVVIHAAFHPQDCCHWGIYDFRDNSLWIGPTAFATTTRLRYVVLHELGHAWQWHSGHLDRLSADMAPWGHRGIRGLEAGADCLSVVWGANASAGHYWSCPSAAAAVVARRLAGDWR